MSTYVKKEIGYLLSDNRFICADCWLDYNWCGMNASPVYHINIGGYSQDCHKCGALVVDGWKSLQPGKCGKPLCLFDKPTSFDEPDLMGLHHGRNE